MLYAVHAESRELYGIDTSSGMVLLKRKIDSGNPHAVTVYDGKIRRFQKGILYNFKKIQAILLLVNKVKLN